MAHALALQLGLSPTDPRVEEARCRARLALLPDSPDAAEELLDVLWRPRSDPPDRLDELLELLSLARQVRQHQEAEARDSTYVGSDWERAFWTEAQLLYALGRADEADRLLGRGLSALPKPGRFWKDGAWRDGAWASRDRERAEAALLARRALLRLDRGLRGEASAWRGSSSSPASSPR